MSRFLVTGGLGVIGSSFVRDILDAGHTAFVIDAGESPRNAWVAERLLDAYPTTCTVRTERLEGVPRHELVGLLSYADFVLHAAASTGIPHSAKDPNDDWVSNVDATRHLLEALREVHDDHRRYVCPKTVCLSSVKPYLTANMPEAGFSEDQPLDPDEPYAASKMAQSALVTAWARTYGVPVMAFRCSNLYGASPCHGPRHGWLTWLCICAAIGRPFDVQGDGTVVRDMLWSSDVTSAVLAAFDSWSDCNAHIFNIGGGRPNSLSVREAVGIVGSLEPSLRTTHGQGRKNEDAVFITDHRSFSAVTGWEPRVPVSEGIWRLLTWARANADALRAIYTNA